MNEDRTPSDDLPLRLRRRQGERRRRFSPAWIAVAAGVALLAVLYAIWILEVLP